MFIIIHGVEIKSFKQNIFSSKFFLRKDVQTHTLKRKIFRAVISQARIIKKKQLKEQIKDKVDEPHFRSVLQNTAQVIYSGIKKTLSILKHLKYCKRLINNYNHINDIFHLRTKVLKTVLVLIVKGLYVVSFHSKVLISHRE